VFLAEISFVDIFMLFVNSGRIIEIPYSGFCWDAAVKFEK